MVVAREANAEYQITHSEWWKGHDAGSQILPAQVFQSLGMVMIPKLIKKIDCLYP